LESTVCLDPEGAHLAALRRLVDLRVARVVEVGCGDGRLTPGIAEHAAAVLAFDPDAAAVS
jgi:16S rRNA A1518/A1519 N6-dimethyltransferase RsmA/KsgA/DIM1 with predicted DNA glycosylase/AP lyase activity